MGPQGLLPRYGCSTSMRYSISAKKKKGVNVECGCDKRQISVMWNTIRCFISSKKRKGVKYRVWPQKERCDCDRRQVSVQWNTIRYLWSTKKKKGVNVECGCRVQNNFLQTCSNLPVVFKSQDIYWLLCRYWLKILKKNSLWWSGYCRP